MQEKSTGLGVSPAAFLILLPRTARAGIVAPDLRAAAHDLLYGLSVSGAGHAGLFQLAALAALEGFFEIVHGGCNCLWRTLSVAVRTAAGAKRGHASVCAPQLFWASAGTRSDSACFATADNLHQVEITGCVFLKALHHGFEHVEGLALV